MGPCNGVWVVTDVVGWHHQNTFTCFYKILYGHCYLFDFMIDFVDYIISS